MEPVTDLRAYIDEWWQYNEELGGFDWKKKPRCQVQVGDVVGTYDKDGYLLAHIHGKRYKVHRLVWFYHKGVMPENTIDHWNLVKDDNRIDNLRDVTHQINCQNSPASHRLEF